MQILYPFANFAPVAVFLFYKQLWSELQTVLAVGKEINAFPCSNWQVRVSQLCVWIALVTICSMCSREKTTSWQYLYGLWIYCIYPVLSSGYLPWSFPPLLPFSLPCSIPPPLASSPSFNPFLGRSLHQPSLPQPTLPPLTFSRCLASLLPPSLPYVPGSFPFLPASLPPAPSLTPSLPLPPSLPVSRIRFWRIVKNQTIDTCNKYDTNTVDTRTLPWVSAPTRSKDRSLLSYNIDIPCVHTYYM